MPNIIEQQDLLKGLPDARLAMLLQNPVGDIPPFLVAAEAQRRQAIRQQFASEAPKESVVDTLTKQIANVPQNVNAPTQTPPMVPPTPPMQGVMALQQQQAMADMAQQPQIMRGGGMVQRYQYGGQVQPWWQIPDISGYVSGLSDYLTGKAGDVYEFATKPYSEREEEKPSDVLPQLDTMTPEELADFNASVVLPNVAVGGKQPAPPKPRPRPDNLPKPEPGETEDQFRARLEALYASPELSDWEKAQRWFAMSEQFLDPSKTTMQSIAGAGQAFAQSAAEQARAQREAELSRDKAMLEYDIAKAEEARQQKVLEQEARNAELKARTDIATGQLDDLRRERRDIAELIRTIQTNAVTSGMSENPGVLAQIKSLREMYDALGNQISSYEGFISQKYGFELYPVVDIDAGTINPPRT